MERFLTALTAGMWTGTLAGFGLAYLVWAHPSKSTGQITFAERAMGEGLAELGVGILGGFAVCLLVIGLVYRFLPPEHFRCMQVVSSVAMVALCSSGLLLMNQPAPQKYVVYVGLLDIEVRVPKPLFLREKLGDGLIVGTSTYLPPDLGRSGKAREDDGFMVKTVSMRVPDPHEWTVTVAGNGIDQLWYKLDWVDHPTEAIPWTDWLAPTTPPTAQSQGIAVRCRWRLAPASSPLQSTRKFF